MQYDELDMNSITDMKNLVHTIINNYIYLKKRFNVTINYCNIGNEYIVHCKGKRELSFGCIKRDEFMSNVIDIRIYNNHIELVDYNTGKPYAKDIDTTKMTDEEKILSAISNWEDYFLN